MGKPSSSRSLDFLLQVERFAFLIGKQLRHQREADPVNVKAAQQMGQMHTLLESSGYGGHALELLLVRLLFLLFGDDTGLWDESAACFTTSWLTIPAATVRTPALRWPVSFRCWISPETNDKPTCPTTRIDLADFSPKMRTLLLDACTLDWGQE